MDLRRILLNEWWFDKLALFGIKVHVQLSLLEDLHPSKKGLERICNGLLDVGLHWQEWHWCCDPASSWVCAIRFDATTTFSPAMETQASWFVLRSQHDYTLAGKYRKTSNFPGCKQIIEYPRMHLSVVLIDAERAEHAKTLWYRLMLGLYLPCNTSTTTLGIYRICRGTRHDLSADSKIRENISTTGYNFPQKSPRYDREAEGMGLDGWSGALARASSHAGRGTYACFKITIFLFLC